MRNQGGAEGKNSMRPVGMDDVDMLLIGGLQGSGKSSLATRAFKDRRRVNRDEIRAFHKRLTCGAEWSAGDWSRDLEPLVTTIEDALIRHELRAGRRLVIDNTLIHERLRAPYVALAREAGRSVGCLFLDVPLEICLARNRARVSPVPEAVVRDFHAARRMPVIAEGFDFVKVVADPAAIAEVLATPAPVLGSRLGGALAACSP